MKRPQQLIDGYIAGTLNAEEMKALGAWLQANPEHRKTFVIETYLNRSIFEIMLSDRMRVDQSELAQAKDDALEATQVQSSDTFTCDIDNTDTGMDSHIGHDDSVIRDIIRHTDSPEERIRIIERYAKKQLDAFLSENRAVTRPVMSPKTPKPIWTWDIRSFAVKVDHFLSMSVRGVVACAAALALSLALIVVYQYYASQRIIAVVGDSVHAEWVETPTQPQLKRGELTLKTGMARLTFMKGAEVLLQAPCQVNLRSAQRFFLNEGNVTAIVPPTAKGFTIDTLNSRVVDYGTEFGVAVDRANQAEVHVYKGEVGLRGASAKRLVQNEAAVINRAGNLTLDKVNERFSIFVRGMPDANQLGIPGRCIDLADVVGGGNGFGVAVPVQTGNQIQGSINPVSGLLNDARRPLSDLYIYDGSMARFGGPGFDALDGTWNHHNSSDYWDGSAPGVGAPGGIGVFQEDETTFLRFQDTGNPGAHGLADPNNRKLYLGHLLDFDMDGVTLEFRARLATTGPLDDRYPEDGPPSKPWPRDGVGGIVSHGGKGMFTIASRHLGPISFSLAKQHELAALPGYENVNSDALVMNNLVGARPSEDVDTNDVGPSIRRRNWHALADTTQWNTFRIHIRAGGPGTHRVSVSVNGRPARTFMVTAGRGFEGQYLAGHSYLAIGSPPTTGSCAFDIDYVSVYAEQPNLRKLSGNPSREFSEVFLNHPTEGFGNYGPVENLPYVDGVFIPDGEEGPYVVSSQGHLFTDCPDTDGTFTGNIISTWTSPVQSTALGIKMAGSMENRKRCIAMHANGGITFDLHQMLNRMPHTRFTSFTARAGLPKQTDANIAEADLWVLVDGRVRFSQQQVRADQWHEINVPLYDLDRYLTLVVTDGARAQKGYRFSQDDACLFIEPVLHLESEH